MDRNSRINDSYLDKVNEKLETSERGEAIGIIKEAKLFHVVLEVRTLVHRYVVHEDSVEAGRQAELSEGIGVYGEGTVSSVRAIEVRDVTKTGPGRAIMENSE
jgi:hypothetical protein